MMLRLSSTSEELPYDYPDKAHEALVCNSFKASEADMKVTINEPFSYDDALRLLSWNLKYDFGNGKKRPVYGDDVTSFKGPIIEALFKGFRASCPDEFVPHRFLFIMEQFNLIYQNSLPASSPNLTAWGKIPQRLAECANKVVDAAFIGNGHMIDKINVMMEDGKAGALPIFASLEEADLQFRQMDLIIDTLWWAFVNAYANCFHYVNPTWAAKLKELFEMDFIEPMIDRWMEVGIAVDYGIMMGDFMIDDIIRNMRYCATSTFILRSIVDKQIARPFVVIGSSGEPAKNSRTAARLL